MSNVSLVEDLRSGTTRALSRLSNRNAILTEGKCAMHTVTKKELIDRIADHTGAKNVLVKKIVQSFLDEIIDELGHGNRLEFRDFGVFESRERAARTAQNPKTLQRVQVPAKRTVRFKLGRRMKFELHPSEQAGEHRPEHQPASSGGEGT